LMVPDYVMQGMIADTGGHSHLFAQHHTLAMITDWVLNPFEHLRRPPMAQMAAAHGVDPVVARRRHCPVEVNLAYLDCNHCPHRRVILVEIDHPEPGHISGSGLFGWEIARKPVGYIDLDTHTGKIVHIRPVPQGTAWKDVPTPEI
jgi:hypothetical protein